MKLEPQYWVVEDSKAVQITKEEMERMVGFVSIFPSKFKANSFISALNNKRTHTDS